MATNQVEVTTANGHANTLLDYAMSYARLGWPIVPLHSVTAHGVAIVQTINCVSRLFTMICLSIFQYDPGCSLPSDPLHRIQGIDTTVGRHGWPASVLF